MLAILDAPTEGDDDATKLMQGERNTKNQKNLGGDSTEIKTAQTVRDYTSDITSKVITDK